MQARIVTLSLAAALSLPAVPRMAGAEQVPHRMEITLERRESGKWRKVDPQTVFAQGDQVRFRYRGSFPGYLYVMNHGSTGDYVKLFPTEQTGVQNRVEANREYMVPASETGAFRISGPPGHDIVYWMVSPVEMGDGRPAPPPEYKPLPPPPKDPQPPPTMTPRCDDTIWKARGECLDRTAGVRAPADTLPANLSGVPGARSRELMFLQDKAKSSSVVSSPVALGGPVIYEFRIAHK